MSGCFVRDCSISNSETHTHTYFLPSLFANTHNDIVFIQALILTLPLPHQDDLLAELEELEQEELDEKLLNTGESVAELPEVPTGNLARVERKKKEEEDDEMAELAAWAS
ncbi:hypothetical protein E2C01_074751 [Portunus trituberculatus]|uniref:Uncharacterized protein n=1 Tax=Portunus trituberculatus TaxID=210409 RepID=A0A5B7I463_PORTR|nr:hypothetical protein [Portunus trituberculatus]